MNKSKKNPPAANQGNKRLKLGGHPSSAQADIDAGMGIADPGVPGSRTNPVGTDRKPQPVPLQPHDPVPETEGELASGHLDLPDTSREKMTVYATAKAAIPDSANPPKTRIAGYAKTNTRMQPVLTETDADAASRQKKQSKD
jgi:hypothetical protein